MSHSHMIYEVEHTTQCNNFSELATPDDGRARPKHVMRRPGDNKK